MIAKTEQDIYTLREGGRILAQVLDAVASLVSPGVTSLSLNTAAEEKIRAQNASPSFLGYRPSDAKYPYPAALCVSVNDEVVHGIPSEEKILKEGDIVSLDLGLVYKGLYLDHAVTVPVGNVDSSGMQLIEAAREALEGAIQLAVPGAHTGDIGALIEQVSKKYAFCAVKELGGHAVGKAVHERPFIPNSGKKGEGEKITEGMVLAIEPMLSEGKGNIITAPDHWTCLMRDGSRAAHFEHTILVTKDGPEILTLP